MLPMCPVWTPDKGGGQRGNRTPDTRIFNGVLQINKLVAISVGLPVVLDPNLKKCNPTVPIISA